MDQKVPTLDAHVHESDECAAGKSKQAEDLRKFPFVLDEHSKFRRAVYGLEM
jgi:hypothetical protein